MTRQEQMIEGIKEHIKQKKSMTDLVHYLENRELSYFLSMPVKLVKLTTPTFLKVN